VQQIPTNTWMQEIQDYKPTTYPSNPSDDANSDHDDNVEDVTPIFSKKDLHTVMIIPGITLEDESDTTEQ
jgi:hypothetical protein